MISRIKTVSTLLVVITMCLACFFYGGRVERLKAEAAMADLEKNYAQHEAAALKLAETIRREQEAMYLDAMAALKRDTDDRLSDADRVRQQFAERQSRRDTDVEQCNLRAQRCERLLSEAYELAGESEGLLKERDARLGAIKRGQR